MKESNHIETKCQKCKGRNPVWSADNDLWNRVVGSPNGILCPTCFFEMANQKGVEMFGINTPIQLKNFFKILGETPNSVKEEVRNYMDKLDLHHKDGDIYYKEVLIIKKENIVGINGGGSPVYQIRQSPMVGAWHTVDYDRYKNFNPEHRRIIYQ